MSGNIRKSFDLGVPTEYMCVYLCISTKPSFQLSNTSSLSRCLSLLRRYYLDYQNRRPEYVEKWMYKLVNWDFVAENLDKALPESKKKQKDTNEEEEKKKKTATTNEDDEL